MDFCIFELHMQCRKRAPLHLLVGMAADFVDNLNNCSERRRLSQEESPKKSRTNNMLPERHASRVWRNNQRGSSSWAARRSSVPTSRCQHVTWGRGAFIQISHANRHAHLCVIVRLVRYYQQVVFDIQIWLLDVIARPWSTTFTVAMVMSKQSYYIRCTL